MLIGSNPINPNLRDCGEMVNTADPFTTRDNFQWYGVVEAHWSPKPVGESSSLSATAKWKLA